MKWTVEIKGENEETVLKYLKALTETFAIAVKFNQPLDHAFMSNRDSSLTCEKVEE